MSKHWCPDHDAGPLAPARARREWTRVQGYWRDEVRSRPLPHGSKAGLVLVAVACVGAVFGMYQLFGPREVIAPGAQAQWISPEPGVATRD